MYAPLSFRTATNSQSSWINWSLSSFIRFANRSSAHQLGGDQRKPFREWRACAGVSSLRPRTCKTGRRVVVLVDVVRRRRRYGRHQRRRWTTLSTPLLAALRVFDDGDSRTGGLRIVRVGVDRRRKHWAREQRLNLTSRPRRRVTAVDDAGNGKLAFTVNPVGGVPESMDIGFDRRRAFMSARRSASVTVDTRSHKGCMFVGRVNRCLHGIKKIFRRIN